MIPPNPNLIHLSSKTGYILCQGHAPDANSHIDPSRIDCPKCLYLLSTHPGRYVYGLTSHSSTTPRPNTPGRPTALLDTPTCSPLLALQGL